MKTGAIYKNGLCHFCVWAPLARSMEIHILGDSPKVLPLTRNEKGYWQSAPTAVEPGTDYKINADHNLRPDPASAHQPDGPHGPSRTVDHSRYDWQHKTPEPIELKDYILYELHVGTFTPEGTFEAAAQKLDYLKHLGVNAIEIMPVAQFPGERNWGYDGTHIFAVQNSYGGPDGLKYFVDQAHKRGMAVVLDVVYNHFGPEGNYMWGICPYTNPAYHTPWGDALNFDASGSDEFRQYLVDNTLFWFEHYRIDALRLDAVHGIFDFGATHFLSQLCDSTKRFCRENNTTRYLIAESDLNDVTVITDREKRGWGMHAQWCDDFHHCLHTLLTGESDGYYKDFGSIEQMAKSFKQAVVYDGVYSKDRNRTHGNAQTGTTPDQYVVFSQNHDQTGNRMSGERLISLAGFEAAKLAAAAVLLSPFTPLLFMGEETAQQTPFYYFISHTDEQLVEAVRKGRVEEFKRFEHKAPPPDPQDEKTFSESKIKWDILDQTHPQAMFKLYKTLIKTRREILPHLTRGAIKTSIEEQTLLIEYTGGYVLALNFAKTPFAVPFSDSAQTIIYTADAMWAGTEDATPLTPGRLIMAPQSAALVCRKENI